MFSPNRRREPVNCVFTDMNVSPRVDGPAVVAGSATPPTIRWRRGNGGSYRNDRFSVSFRTHGGALIASTPFRDGQNHRPTPSEWRAIRQAAGDSVRVSVVGRQMAHPVTGPYRSCTKVFTLA